MENLRKTDPTRATEERLTELMKEAQVKGARHSREGTSFFATAGA